jgi:cellulose synthase/poly-beta-1,6-N-acetylglucosamine synthase-like glycosyltransferase
VSALVAAWNDREHLDAHVQSFLALTYPTIELILCAGGTDGTYEAARRYAGERVVVLEQHPGEGKQGALARCYERARGEIILLTDADCVYEDGALLRLLQPLIDEGELVATGGSRPLDGQLEKVLPAYIWAADTVVNVRSGPYADGLLGRNSVLSRRAVERIGGFGFPAPTGTDYQLARRLILNGLAIRHVAASVIPTNYPEDLPTYRRKRSRWLRNLIMYGRGYGATIDVLVTLKTVLAGAVMTLAPFMSPVCGNYVLFPWTLLLAQAWAAKLRYLLFTARIYRRRAPIRALLFLLPLTLLDFAIWASPIVDLLDPRRRKAW